MSRKQIKPGNEKICQNKKAFSRYEFEDKLEAGLVLSGSEAKSLRQHQGDLDGSYASIEDGEMFLCHMHIAPYLQATHVGKPEPKRRRKLLLHKQQIEKWKSKLTMRGYTVVPLSLYFKNGYVKVELGLGKGKTHSDQRADLKKKVMLKEAKAEMSRRNKGH